MYNFPGISILSMLKNITNKLRVAQNHKFRIFATRKIEENNAETIILERSLEQSSCDSASANVSASANASANAYASANANPSPSESGIASATANDSANLDFLSFWSSDR